MDIKLPISLLAAWMLSYCSVAKAQGDTTITREIGEVDVYAKKKDGELLVGQKLDYNLIKQMPAASVSDLLRIFNGVNIKDYGGVGGLKTVSVRSLGASHTAVDYDGIPISNTQAGPVDISRFDVSSLSEVKLSVGHDDNMLKPAKCFASGALLSISSLRPTIDNKKNNKIDACLKFGSFGYSFVNLDYARIFSKYLLVKAEAEYMRADGEYDFKLKNAKTETTERRTNTDVESFKGELNLFYNDSLRNDFNVKAYAYYSERGLPGGVIYYVKENFERLVDKNCFVQANYKRRISSNLTSKVVAKCNYSFNCYTDRNSAYSSGLLKQNSTQNELYLSWINMWQISSPFALSVSLDDSYNTLESDITDRQPKRNTMQAAVNLRYKLRNWLNVLLTGVGTHLREHTESGGHFDDLDKFSPSVSVAICPFDFRDADFTVRLLYKNTYRVPTFNELYYTTLGSTNLKPEDASEFNLGLDFSWGKLSGISVDLFRNYVDNKIVAIPTTYVWKMSNYGNVEITGADLMAHTGLKINDVELLLRAGYSYQEALDKTKGKSPKLYGAQIPYTPLHSGNYELGVNTKYADLSYTSIWSGKRYFLAYNIPDNEIEKYMEHSVSVSRAFNFDWARFFMKISCVNIFDKQYDIIKFYPMPGRHWQLQLNLTL